jgi:hypothetical protein
LLRARERDNLRAFCAPDATGQRMQGAGHADLYRDLQAMALLGTGKV